MYKNVLVCCGLLRATTTYLFAEICNFEQAHSSRLKETYLFQRSSTFVELKLRTLKLNRLYLDFTPEYIFNAQSIGENRTEEFLLFSGDASL
jgi:hypothetical protein